MNYAEAYAKHRFQWATGKHLGTLVEYEFPYNFLYEDEKFITVEVDINICRPQEVDATRVNEYMNLLSQDIDLGCPWVTCGKLSNDGSTSMYWHNKCYALDGNHRLEAARSLGNTTINVIVPETDYIAYTNAQKVK